MKYKLPKELYGPLIIAASVIIGSILIAISIFKAATAIHISANTLQYDPFKELKSYNMPEIDRYDPRYGNNNNVIIFEYTDYQCPFCRRHTLQTFPKIKENYIDTGKISYVYKDFPLSFHRYSLVAAKYANCVYYNYGIDAFSKFKTWLFENQANWTNENYKSAFEEELKKLGLDIDKIESCVNSPEVEKDISEDLKEVSEFRLGGTPSFVIAINKKYVTNEELNELKDLVDELSDYGVRMKLGRSKDNNYIFVIFSGALPYEVFQKILNIGTS